MKTKSIFLFGFILSLIYGCNSSLHENKLLGETKTITLSGLKSSLIDTLVFKDCKVVELETTDESILSYIAQVCIVGDTLFIFDRNQNSVFIFDTDGNYINKINDIGEGPMEYIRLLSIRPDICNQRIALLCDYLIGLCTTLTRGNLLMSLSTRLGQENLQLNKVTYIHMKMTSMAT